VRKKRDDARKGRENMRKKRDDARKRGLGRWVQQTMVDGRWINYSPTV
jgi:hypothetical protein